MRNERVCSTHMEQNTRKRRRPTLQRRVNTTVPIALYERVVALEKEGVYFSFAALLTEALERAVQDAEALHFA